MQQKVQTPTLRSINAICAARVSKQAVHTMLSEEQYQHNLKRAAAFTKDVLEINNG